MMNCEMTMRERRLYEEKNDFMRERRLYEASLGGDITSLMELLKEDPLILERVVTSFTETPLHIAAMSGHIDFANELLRRKPDLTSESDSHGFSPLHLAASRKNIDMVKLLLVSDPDVCNATDQDGRTPLHLAAMKGRLEAMKELINVCPKAIHRVVSDQGGETTILHLCVKHSRLEALKLLLEELNNNKGEILDDSSISINSKDGDGNTILHLAVAKKHWEMIKFLLDNNESSTNGIEVNALNKSGFTSLDVLIIQSARDLKDIEIREFLRGAGCLRAPTSFSADELLPSQGQQQIPKTVQPKTNINHNQEEKSADWLKTTTNSLMVVASLIATMAFQAGLTPPGGLWPADVPSSQSPSGSFIPFADIGTSIMADKHPVEFSLQVFFNTIGFIASLSIILLLISGLPLKRRFFVWILVIIMWIAVTSMALSFIFTGILTVWEKTDDYASLSVENGVFVWMGLICLIIVLHFCRLMYKCCGRYKPMNYIRNISILQVPVLSDQLATTSCTNV